MEVPMTRVFLWPKVNSILQVVLTRPWLIHPLRVRHMFVRTVIEWNLC